MFTFLPKQNEAIPFSYPIFLLMILVENFMLINNRIKTWVGKLIEMKLLIFKVLQKI